MSTTDVGNTASQGINTAKNALAKIDLPFGVNPVASQGTNQL